METPLQRTIRIGNALVGLLGLDQALNALLQQDGITDEEAASRLYTAVKKNNYIPPGMEQSYREALQLEYTRLRNNQAAMDGGDLTIRILGRPCVSCNNLKNMTIEILQEMGVAADIIDVQDLDEIWRYGVTKTPALIINDRVICAGAQPSRSQLEQWLQEITAAAGTGRQP